MLYCYRKKKKEKHVGELDLVSMKGAIYPFKKWGI